jgi:F-box and leucine-rich repeat protein 14
VNDVAAVVNSKESIRQLKSSVRSLRLVGAEDDWIALLASRGSICTLDLSGSANIGADGLVELGQMAGLRSLNLAGCSGVTELTLQTVCKLSGLQELDLSMCSMVSASALAELANLRLLRRVVLDWCDEVDDPVLEILSGLPFLERLSLWGCDKVTNTGIEHVSGAAAMRSIEVPEFAQVDDDGIGHLARNLTTLRRLRLANLSITDKAMAELADHSQLEELRLSHCPGVSFEGLALVLSTPSLESLTLSGLPQSAAALIERLRSLRHGVDISVS